MDIVTSLTAISQALGIAKEIKEIDRGVDDAEFKLKVAELMSALAEAKVSLSDAQAIITQLNERISELETGPRCPICLQGKLNVQQVRVWDNGTQWETHTCRCSDATCSHHTERVFNRSALVYRE